MKVTNDPVRSRATLAFCCDVYTCVLTGTKKWNKYTYYFCTNGRDICKQYKKYICEKCITDKVAEALNYIIVDRGLATKSLEVYKRNSFKEYDNHEETKVSLEKPIEALKDRLNRLLDV